MTDFKHPCFSWITSFVEGHSTWQTQVFKSFGNYYSDFLKERTEVSLKGLVPSTLGTGTPFKIEILSDRKSGRNHTTGLYKEVVLSLTIFLAFGDLNLQPFTDRLTAPPYVLSCRQKREANAGLLSVIPKHSSFSCVFWAR